MRALYRFYAQQRRILQNSCGNDPAWVLVPPVQQESLMTPHLSSARLRLVPYSASMVTGRHVAWLNDPEVVRYSEQRHQKHTLESQHSYLNRFPIGSHIWLITPNEDVFSLSIGSITAHVDKPNMVANMGIMIGDKSKWQQGYGTEAWKTVMDFLFDQQIRKIEAGCARRNTAMRTICEKTEMVLEAEIRDHFLIDGKPVNLLTYGIFR